ncbi:FAD-binding oxidoreductase [Streptomyces flaveolus]|uniref:FAD-binding oxidoreductase n=1 Tax=Streptomyces flaveolus TaxID=67297 RepID=UPI003700CFFC
MTTTPPVAHQPSGDWTAPLAQTITGTVLTPDQPGFAQACATYNLSVTHSPAAVVQAADATDVQEAVRFAKHHGLPVAVIATGHQPIAPARDCVLIRTSKLDSITVDPVRRTARIGAGARWRQIVDETTKFGLAPLCGSSPTVAAAGFILGGGISPLMGRSYGWAADHVTAVEIVTADGSLRRATATSDPDLFWAVRGGKSNFGVVTSLEIGLFSVGTFFGGGLYYAGDHAAEVLHAYRKLTENAPEELNTSVALLRLPPLPQVPTELRGKLTVHVRVCHLGSAEEGETLLAPLRAAAPRLIDTVTLTPFAEFDRVHQDPVDPVAYEERSAMLSTLPAEAIEVLVDLAGPQSNSGISLLEIRHLEGAFNRLPQIPNAVGNRDVSASVWGAVMGTPDEQKIGLENLQKILDRLTPWQASHKYLNFMSGHDPVEEAYTPEVLNRLQMVKRAYDPDNVFRVNNHNILPKNL